MLVQTSEPAVEPISLADAKLHLRVDEDTTDDDTLILLLIKAARGYAESYTGRSFITRNWRLTLDGFPTGCMDGYWLPGIALERGIVQSISSVVYRDMAGAMQTIAFDAPLNGVQRSSDGNIVADLSGLPARVTPAFGRIWPIPMPEIGAVQVNYSAGYGDTAGTVPHGIRQWLLMRVNTLYENREAVAILPRGKVEPLPFIDTLLDPYTVATA